MTPNTDCGARVVCPLCVQYRCRICGWYCIDDMEHSDQTDPVWPDGSVATLTQSEWCDRCARAVADYQAECRASEPWAYEQSPNDGMEA